MGGIRNSLLIFGRLGEVKKHIFGVIRESLWVCGGIMKSLGEA